jgi:hypothetical protein
MLFFLSCGIRLVEGQIRRAMTANHEQNSENVEPSLTSLTDAKKIASSISDSFTLCASKQCENIVSAFILRAHSSLCLHTLAARSVCRRLVGRSAVFRRQHWRAVRVRAVARRRRVRKGRQFQAGVNCRRRWQYFSWMLRAVLVLV